MNRGMELTSQFNLHFVQQNLTLWLEKGVPICIYMVKSVQNLDLT